MIAVALLFFAVHPDFYLPDDQFDDKYIPVTIEHLSNLWLCVWLVERQIGINADPEIRLIMERKIDFVQETIEVVPSRLLEDRRSFRQHFLKYLGKNPVLQARLE